VILRGQRGGNDRLMRVHVGDGRDADARRLDVYLTSPCAKERIAMVTLEGQKVVVTGGSRGLGLGIVEALVAQKAHVTVVARDPERAH
jgi:D-arabinose 1-dehydrogenase-like Zn-dependent alcohol dehydrogenase